MGVYADLYTTANGTTKTMTADNKTTACDLYMDKDYIMNGYSADPRLIYDPASLRYGGHANIVGMDMEQEEKKKPVIKEGRLDLCSRHLWN